MTDTPPSATLGSVANYILLCIEVMFIGAVLCGVGWSLYMSAFVIVNDGSEAFTPLGKFLKMLLFGPVITSIVGIITAVVCLPAALVAGWPVWRWAHRLFPRRSPRLALRLRLWAMTAIWCLASMLFIGVVLGGVTDKTVIFHMWNFAPFVVPGALIGGACSMRFYRALQKEMSETQTREAAQ